MTGFDESDEILAALRKKHPKMNIVLTLGSEGALCDTPSERIYQPVFQVQVTDTTAAGDTFTGYFIASYTQGCSLKKCMERAAAAAAISVSRAGASVSIPFAEETEAILANIDVL